jgi:hypothetical protein
MRLWRIEPEMAGAVAGHYPASERLVWSLVSVIGRFRVPGVARVISTRILRSGASVVLRVHAHVRRKLERFGANGPLSSGR